MANEPAPPGPPPLQVCLVALSDGVVSTLFGIFDAMNAFALMDLADAGTGARAPFRLDIVGETAGA